MIFDNQRNAIKQLELLAQSNRQSILIDGPQGCGKTYLAENYTSMLGVNDFVVVKPTVAAINEAIDMGYSVQSPVVMCIENLDTGVPQASYTLLKCLEEPMPNVYIVVTARNIKILPDTIVSRSAVISLGPPTQNDIQLHAMSINADKYNLLKNENIWNVVLSFDDVLNVLNMTPDQLSYFKNDLLNINYRDSISNVVWKLNHYPDNSDVDPEFVVRYLLSFRRKDKSFAQKCLSALRDLQLRRIAPHAILSKFVLDCKYGE